MNPYALGKEEKRRALLEELNALTHHHLQHCPDYARLFQRLRLKNPPYTALADIPFLPAELFKRVDLLSIPREEVFKTLLSSGTSAAVPSRIYLDRATAQRQTAALAAIVGSFLGPERLPILLVDSEATLRDRALFSARGAAIAGMLTFGRDPFYLLDPDMAVRRDAFDAWRQRHAGEAWLIFGVTHLLWKHFLLEWPPGTLQLPQAIVFHGGGWKRMEAEGISNADFKERLRDTFGIQRCHNFYGMVEQTGSIYMECEQGVLHASDFSEALFRDQETLEEAPAGQVGVIQTLSVLPRSYPGHSLLTEDLGFEAGVDQCPCGRKGKIFQVVGRVPQAELRGCSDVGAA